MLSLIRGDKKTRFSTLPIKNYSFTILFLKYSGRYIALLKDVACFNFKLELGGWWLMHQLFQLKPNLKQLCCWLAALRAKKIYSICSFNTCVSLRSNWVINYDSYTSNQTPLHRSNFIYKTVSHKFS